MSGLPFIRVVDLETTGNSFTDGGVVEIGWQDLEQTEDGWQLSGPPAARLVDPQRPISAATSAIHHIVDEDVANSPTWLAVAPEVLQPERTPLALVAHRAAFEQRWCAGLARGTPWICTYKCALRIWPEAPGHSNQGLRYWRRPVGLEREVGLPAHRAGPDAYVTAFHVRDMLGSSDLTTLIAWSAEPALLARIPYGRLRGRRVRELSEEDLSSLAASERMDSDLGFTARYEQRRRADGAASRPAAEAQQALLSL